MNLSSIAVAAFLSSLSITEATMGRVRGDGDRDTAALKGVHTTAAAGTGLEEGRQLKKKNADVCGPETETSCVSTLNVRSSSTLVDCFNKTNSTWLDTLVTILEYSNGTNLEVSKLTFPQVNFANFNKANFNSGQGMPRFPAGIFYAESQDEVITAVNCARKAGYKVSPRGRGHSYQGLSSMDGYLVIDMSLMCDPEKFIPTTFDDDVEPWILGGGQKPIGSIKSGSGCTNAVMLAYTANKFPEGIYLIGSCPTVGITGYATGGGQGDTTPWVGLGIDDVLSYDIVLYNGTAVTASATENFDLYWALRGGGSGYGVITSLETAVINTPEPSSGFTYISYRYNQTQNEARQFFELFQDFLDPPDLPFGSEDYKEKIRTTSARFGGAGSYVTNSSVGPLSVVGLFLGSKDEANATFTEAGLLDPEILDGHNMFEFSSYADAQLFILCTVMSSSNINWPFWTTPSLDVCEDLGIPSKYCHEIFFNGDPDMGSYLVPNCDFGHKSWNLDDVKNVILPKIAEVAIEPQSWFNRPGMARFAWAGALVDSTWQGGLLHGRLEPDVLLEIANVGVAIFHFAHGAAMVVARNETGYYNREEFTLLSLNSMEQYEAIASILINKAYDGDSSKLRGFYNYLNPAGNRDWRNYYFGDNYEELSVVKAKYDKTNGFGNPLQVEPAPSSSKAGEESHDQLDWVITGTVSPEGYKNFG